MNETGGRGPSSGLALLSRTSRIPKPSLMLSAFEFGIRFLLASTSRIVFAGSASSAISLSLLSTDGSSKVESDKAAAASCTSGWKLSEWSEEISFVRIGITDVSEGYSFAALSKISFQSSLWDKDRKVPIMELEYLADEEVCITKFLIASGVG